MDTVREGASGSGLDNLDNSKTCHLCPNLPITFNIILTSMDLFDTAAAQIK
jgi:hypothetical protein